MDREGDRGRYRNPKGLTNPAPIIWVIGGGEEGAGKDSVLTSWDSLDDPSNYLWPHLTREASARDLPAPKPGYTSCDPHE